MKKMINGVAVASLVIVGIVVSKEIKKKGVEKGLKNTSVYADGEQNGTTPTGPRPWPPTFDSFGIQRQ